MTPNHRALPINSIQVGKRKRPLRESRVTFLARSIRQLGLLQPIIVEQVGHKYYLVAGLHRIEACQLLGWTEIPATVRVDLDDLSRELAEIDENLERASLTEMEEAEHLQRRQQIYEMLHPKTKVGAAQAAGMNRSQGHDVADNLSVTLTFTEDTAAKTNQSARNIRRKLKRAKDIPQDVRDAIRETPIADNGSELDALAKMEPEEQRRVANLVVEGKVESVRQAAPTTSQLLTSSKSNEWYSPSEVVEPARVLFGGIIDLDPASCEEANEVIQAVTFYTKEQDGLSMPWFGSMWLNPPYGKDDNHKSNAGRWTRHLIHEYSIEHIDQAVTLVNAAIGRIWFNELWQFPICFPYKRIQFWQPGSKRDQPTFGNTIAYLGPNHEAFADLYAPLGQIIMPKSKGISISYKFEEAA